MEQLISTPVKPVGAGHRQAHPLFPDRFRRYGPVRRHQHPLLARAPAGQHPPSFRGLRHLPRRGAQLRHPYLRGHEKSALREPAGDAHLLSPLVPALRLRLQHLKYARAAQAVHLRGPGPLFRLHPEGHISERHRAARARPRSGAPLPLRGRRLSPRLQKTQEKDRVACSSGSSTWRSKNSFRHSGTGEGASLLMIAPAHPAFPFRLRGHPGRRQRRHGASRPGQIAGEQGACPEARGIGLFHDHEPARLPEGDRASPRQGRSARGHPDQQGVLEGYKEACRPCRLPGARGRHRLQFRPDRHESCRQ